MDEDSKTAERVSEVPLQLEKPEKAKFENVDIGRRGRSSTTTTKIEDARRDRKKFIPTPKVLLNVYLLIF